jgi:hypothetical protein
MADRGYKECGGGSICESMVGEESLHKEECGGSSICEHGRRKEVAKGAGAAAYVTWQKSIKCREA